MKSILALSVFFAGMLYLAPADATEVREAIRLCDKNPNCSYRVRDNGSVDITVSDDSGGKYINCPQKGQCTCDICRVAPTKSKLRAARGAVGGVLKAD